MTAWNQFWTGSAAAHWPTTEGQIVASQVGERDGLDGGTYHAEVHYSYGVAGAKYQGKRVAVDDSGTNHRGRAEKIVDRYPVGAKVTVFYNPNRPEKAVLEPKTTGGWLLWFVMGFLFIWIIAVYWGALFKGLLHSVLLGFAILFVMAGLIILVTCYRGYWPIWQLAWAGDITQGKVVRGPEKKGPRRTMVEYQVGDQTHRIRDYEHSNPRKTVDVLYPRDKPEAGMIYSFAAVWLVPFLALAAGVGFTLVGGLLLRSFANGLKRSGKAA